MKKIIQALAALTILAIPAAANRAVMEELAASANTVFVDTINVRLGVSTATPATTLDVAGNMQVGQGATKSTFTAAGALTLASGAALNLSGANGNIISASSITTTGGVFGNGGGLTSLSGANITGPVPQASVNLSTVATAFATKASSGTNADITVLGALTTVSNPWTSTSSETNTSVGGILVTNGISAGGVSSFTATGANHAIQTSSDVYVTGNMSITGKYLGNGALLTNLPVAGGAAALATANTFTSTNVFSIPLSSGMSVAVSGNTNQTSFVLCQATVSISIPAGSPGNVMVGTNLSASTNQGLGQGVFVGLLKDGAYFAGQSTSLGLTAADSIGSGDHENLSFSIPIFGLSVGNHTFCLGAVTGAGTLTFGGESVSFLWTYMLP